MIIVSPNTVIATVAYHFTVVIITPCQSTTFPSLIISLRHAFARLTTIQKKSIKTASEPLSNDNIGKIS